MVILALDEAHAPTTVLAKEMHYPVQISEAMYQTIQYGRAPIIVHVAHRSEGRRQKKFIEGELQLQPTPRLAG